MPLLGSDRQSELSRAAVEVLQGASRDRWKELLALPIADGFAAVTSRDVAPLVFPEAETTRFNDWVLNIRDWQSGVLDPRTQTSYASGVLHDVWDDFEPLLL